MTTVPSQRASLLASLRTGGVRSVSSQVPSTAPLLSPSASHFPRSSTVDSFSQIQMQEAEILADQFVQMQLAQHPQTAAPNASVNAMHLQQQMMYGMSGYTQEEILLAQMQRQQQVQLELVRLQLLQHQAQAQAQLLAMHAQQQQAETTRQSQHTTSFDSLRSAASSAAARRASRGALDAVEPMTAVLSGRFGTRLNPQASTFRSASIAEETLGTSTPLTAGFVVPSTAKEPGHISPPRKSDVATSWRRGSSASPAPARKTPSPPTVVVSRPDEYPVTPGLTTGSSTKSGRRPSPLQLIGSHSPKSVTSVMASSDEEGVDSIMDASPPALSNSPTSSSPTSVSPTSVHHPATAIPVPVEAAKRLYEGLGMGRPHVRSASVSGAPSGTHTPVASILRQPRGPPSGADELGLRNFASRVRRRAVSGLEVLKSARERVPGEEVLVY
ncbi:hypothetical protein DACRYDRAFT_18608 [Dacryopinax primogenitus]|uniref:Uncharacterized protein n=1 Tax=Dacryopinax primogenitus (strain DJM 731) TaxID=1858805 RepID=M5G1N5_DACPD|nr:uncharacterized protein DACRYDRAFT_18608 [Dacryopinax primogenitus]EJT97652.1 hypothetical protein DACRYDRAFT_18608 [Dacryopinax primogenitus]